MNFKTVRILCLVVLCGLMVISGSPVPAKQLTFLVIGDWGWNGYFGQKDVALQMGKTASTTDAGFIISTGDNFQVNGVRSTDDPLWQTTFENVYSNPFLLVDWYCVLGNHDYLGNPQAEIDYSKKSRRWNMPARYYSHQEKVDEKTAVDFYFLDTSPFQDIYYKDTKYANVQGQDTTRQLRWLDSSLAASKSRWKIVVGHHPVYTSGAHASQLTAMPGRFAHLFERNGVDAYFCGHDHDLECLKSDSGTTYYFVSGGGSDRIRPVKATARTKFLACVPGFMAVSIESDTMKVRIIDTKGVTLFTEKIVK